MTGPTATEQLEAIQEGTRQAVESMLRRFDAIELADLIHDAIKQGVIDSFPFADRIELAIMNGVIEAQRNG